MPIIKFYNFTASTRKGFSETTSDRSYQTFVSVRVICLSVSASTHRPLDAKSVILLCDTD